MIESNHMGISTISLALVFYPILFNLPLNFFRYEFKDQAKQQIPHRLPKLGGEGSE